MVAIAETFHSVGHKMHEKVQHSNQKIANFFKNAKTQTALKVAAVALAAMAVLAGLVALTVFFPIVGAIVITKIVVFSIFAAIILACNRR